MDPSRAVIWLFLGIFVLTALIALCSLVGLVRLEPYYKKTLFRLLILEVVGCVIGFGVQTFRTIRTARADIHSVLLRGDHGWDWQYAQNGWRAQMHFREAGVGRIEMSGNMYLVGPNTSFPGQDKSKPIITWQSAAPFDVASGSSDVTFKAIRIWTDEGAKAYPQMKYEVGKKTEVKFKIRLDDALAGSVIGSESHDAWNLTMTPGLPWDTAR